MADRRRKKAARDFVAKSQQLEAYRLKAKLKKANRARVAALRALDAAEARNGIIAGIREAEGPTITPRLRSPKRPEATAITLCSDWHVEERVDPGTVAGRNTYSPQEAEKRAIRLFDRAADMTNLAAKAQEVRDAVIWLGGDLITGHIHEDGLEGNHLSPTEAVIFAQRLAHTGILSYLEQTSIEQVRVVCSYGNHGRTTPRRRVATAAKNSFEWLMYHNLAAATADDERIQVHVANGSQIYADIYGWRVRFHHGDDVRGGAAGLEAPVRRAVDAWDTVKPADLTCLGHFHQLRHYPRAVVNGSLIGWNAYAQSIRARYEPPQQAFFLLDKRRGRTLTAPLDVTP